MKTMITLSTVNSLYTLTSETVLHENKKSSNKMLPQ